MFIQVPDDLGVVDGFSIRYKHIIDMRYQQFGPEVTRRVPYRPLFYMIGGLASYEYYEICVMATSGGSVSDCSNRLKVLTGESGMVLLCMLNFLKRQSQLQQGR